MERPMLFNTEMVKAILKDMKTQTRRLVKGLPLTEPHATEEDGKLLISDENGDWFPAERYSRIQPGDVLWVRETWAKCSNADSYVYKADFDGYAAEVFLPGMKWRPSIHMPKEAARLFLRVTDVWCERLQDITEDDAIAEGASGGAYQDEQGNVMDIVRPSEDFANIWDSTIKKADLPRYGWEANPWVWMYDFERIVSP